jgi:hypothetical protein
MWHEFGDRAAAIGDDDRLARCSEANVFTELILQDLEGDGMHELKVASGSFFVNFLRGSDNH